MKLNARTLEAFRNVNGFMRYMSRYQYAYPGFNQKSCYAPYKLMVAKRGYSCGHGGVFCLGDYFTEDLLRAGVETLAEFLEEVV